MPKVNFVLRNGETKVIAADAGLSLMQIAKAHGLEVEGACGGAMACSTCHLIVEKEWFKKLMPASDDELDMLDLATGLTKTSRLGCQIKMTEALDGLTVRLPKATTSMLG